MCGWRGRRNSLAASGQKCRSEELFSLELFLLFSSLQSFLYLLLWGCFFVVLFKVFVCSTLKGRFFVFFFRVVSLLSYLGLFLCFLLDGRFFILFIRVVSLFSSLGSFLCFLL